MPPTLNTPLVQHAPRYTFERALSLAVEFYNISGTVDSLPSERDQNFLLTDSAGQRFVLKIANALEDDALLRAQSDAMMHVGERVSFCQRLVASVNGNILERVTSPTGESNLVRLATYLPGIALGEAREHSPGLLYDLGYKLGQMDAALLSFDRDAIHRNFHWDLANWQTVITEHSDLISDSSIRVLILTFARAFETTVAPLLAGLRRSVIHGDTNDYNILLNDTRSEVVGIIDFGDMVYSYTTADLAIALAYVVLNNDSPVPAATNVVAGFHQALPLANEEIDAIWGLMIMRLCMSVCIAAYQQQQRPDNKYLDISQEAIRSSLPKLLAIDADEATARFREAVVQTT